MGLIDFINLISFKPVTEARVVWKSWLPQNNFIEMKIHNKMSKKKKKNYSWAYKCHLKATKPKINYFLSHSLRNICSWLNDR